MKANPVVWFEIYVQDMARASRFYESVLQIKLAPLQAPEGDASGFEMLAFPGDPQTAGACGTLVKMAGVTPGQGAPGTLVSFGSEDCAAEQSRVVAAGGSVHKEKFSIGPYGFCALLMDTEGNCFGVHSMK
jgi:predicted enzyme related to lactoylglutathione lyase